MSRDDCAVRNAPDAFAANIWLHSPNRYTIRAAWQPSRCVIAKHLRVADIAPYHRYGFNHLESEPDLLSAETARNLRWAGRYSGPTGGIRLPYAANHGLLTMAQ